MWSDCAVAPLPQHGQKKTRENLGREEWIFSVLGVRTTRLGNNQHPLLFLAPPSLQLTVVAKTTRTCARICSSFAVAMVPPPPLVHVVPVVVNATAWIPPMVDDTKRHALLDVLGRFEIQNVMGMRLRYLLAGQKKVLVLDNSGSMGRTVADSSIVHQLVVTRSDELLFFLAMALPILVADAPEGIDVWLLNDANGRPVPTALYQVHTVDQVRPYLINPRGSTPLVQCSQHVFATYATSVKEAGLHILVATDGAHAEPASAL